MKKLVLLLGATTIVAATSAFANPAADLDGNGEVTRAEFMAAGDARFAAADTNFDGQLSRDEMKTLRDNERTEQARKRFSKMDGNGDGVVSEAEMLAAQEMRKERMTDRRDDRREGIIERFDTNADGELSDAERKAARDAGKEMRKEKRQADAKKRKEKKGKRPRLDADKDGFVTLAEYTAMGEKLFARMDADGNGILTQGEGRKGRRGPPKPRR